MSKKNIIKKTTYLNVDSRHRNKLPSNIVESNLKLLSNNPITISEDSNEIKIYYPNHKLKVNDKILIQNIEGKSKKLSAPFYLIQNFDYVLVNFPDHKLSSNYLKYQDNFQVEIKMISELETTEYMFDNISINSFLGINNIYFYSSVEASPVDLETTLGVTTEELENNYFYLKLPFDYISVNTTFNIDKIVEINFLNLGNIPLAYLNSNYPINDSQYQGFQNVTKIEDDYIYFNSNIKSYLNDSGGGSKVNVSKILKSITGYPSSNAYKINLKNNFVNVTSIQLVSVSIPYVDNIIIASGAKKNNMLYWKQIEDGDTIYSIEIPEGDYTQKTLKDKILNLMNSIERVNSTLKDPLYNLFEIDLSVKEMEFEIRSYAKYNLPDSITVDTVTIDSHTFYRLTIVHQNNLVEVDDEITIEGSNQIGNLPDTYINKTHKIYSIDKSTQSYVVLINYVNLSSTTEAGNGGNNVVITTKSLISLLFDRPYTIGNILGFKNVGNKNSITNYSNVIKNCCTYKCSKKLNSVGILDEKKNIIKLSYYEKDYFLLYINKFETIDNNGSLPPCFAKIIIDEILCKEFISNKYVLPLPSLNELDISFLNPDGSPTDFRNIENSFVLKVVEDIVVNDCIGMNSKIINYD